MPSKRAENKERIERIYKEFAEMIGTNQVITSEKNSSLRELAKFGLTPKEAKAWLKKEPKYFFDIADESLQRKHDRRRLDRTRQSLLSSFQCRDQKRKGKFSFLHAHMY